MKTAAAILENANTPAIKRMGQMLCDQLVDIMPELEDVSPWHEFGQRRSLDEYGRVVDRRHRRDRRYVVTGRRFVVCRRIDV